MYIYVQKIELFLIKHRKYKMMTGIEDVFLVYHKVFRLEGVGKQPRLLLKVRDLGLHCLPASFEGIGLIKPHW